MLERKFFEAKVKPSNRWSLNDFAKSQSFAPLALQRCCFSTAHPGTASLSWLLRQELIQLIGDGFRVIKPNLAQGDSLFCAVGPLDLITPATVL